MSLWIDLAKLAAGFFLIIKGGDLFVASSVRIAELLRVSRVVIGTTLVSLATTSPELVFSVTTGVEEDPAMGIGNALGSCMCNMCLILGLMSVIRSIGVRPSDLRIPFYSMVFFGLLLLALSWNLAFHRWMGWMLAALGAAYFVCDFLHHRKGSRPEDLVEARSIEDQALGGRPWLDTPAKVAAVFLAGVAMVVAGSKLLVDSLGSLGEGLGVPSLVMGLTVAAVGTSLPELVTAVKSARQNVSDLGVGNILGANVANLTLIVGGATSFQDVQLDRLSQVRDFTALLLGMGMVWWMLQSSRRMHRLEGAILIGYYFLYIALALASPHRPA